MSIRNWRRTGQLGKGNSDKCWTQEAAFFGKGFGNEKEGFILLPPASLQQSHNLPFRGYKVMGASLEEKI